MFFSSIPLKMIVNFYCFFSVSLMFKVGTSNESYIRDGLMVFIPWCKLLSGKPLQSSFKHSSPSRIPLKVSEKVPARITSEFTLETVLWIHSEIPQGFPLNFFFLGFIKYFIRELHYTFHRGFIPLK